MEVVKIIVKSYHTLNFQKTIQKIDFNDDLENFKNLYDNFKIHQINFNRKTKISYYHDNTFNFFNYHILILP